MMKNSLALVMVCGLAAALSASPGPGSSEPVYVAHPGLNEFSGQMIVRPIQQLHPSQKQAAKDALAGMIVKYYPEVDEYVIAVPGATRAKDGFLDGAAENQLHHKLMETGLFQYAVPNWTCYPTNTPNDPLLNDQWHHTKMQSRLGWDISTGLTSIITAFTDTGIDLTHPDLAAKRVHGFDAPNDISEDDGGSVSDLHGHGTHVAGCASAITNNNTGVAGVNWNARIMMIRVTNNSGGGASYDDLMQGARWAADHGAKTVSASYSGISNPPLQTTGEYIKSVGSLYFYAAGNDAANLSSFDWPDVIVVGASDPSDNRAGFSAYGKAVDVFAPGTGILSSVVGGGYQAWDGTSMATPLANGVASIIWSINPFLSPAQVENILFTSCDDLGTPGNDDTYGWGRVNVYKAAQAAAGTVGPQPPIAADDNAGNTFEGEPVTLDVMANDVDLNGDPFVISAFDAVSLHGGTVTRSVGTGPGGRDQLIYSPPFSYIGADSFNYTVTDPGNLSDVGTVTANVLNDSLFRDPDSPINPEPGLGASWYSFSSTQASMPDYASLNPYLQTTVTQLNMYNQKFNVMNSGRVDKVGAVITGFVEVPATDYYTFYIESDDGSKMYIGSDLLISNDHLNVNSEVSQTIALKAGKHAVRIEYFENTVNATLRLSYSSTTLPKTLIPPTSFWHGGSCPADFDGSGFVDIEDYTAFVAAFEAGDQSADFDGSGFVDTDDFDLFVAAFELGC